MAEDFKQPLCVCPFCGGSLQSGFVTSMGLIGGKGTMDNPKIEFIVPSRAKRLGVVGAFLEGLADVPDDTVYQVKARHCQSCGYILLHTS